MLMGARIWSDFEGQLLKYMDIKQESDRLIITK